MHTHVHGPATPTPVWVWPLMLALVAVIVVLALAAFVWNAGEQQPGARAAGVNALGSGAVVDNASDQALATASPPPPPVYTWDGVESHVLAALMACVYVAGGAMIMCAV